MLKKRIVSVIAVACLLIPAGSALAGGPQPHRIRIGIQAMDYHFMLQNGSDFPRKLDRGEYRFRFHNASEKRLHEVVMFKLRHGKTIKQLLRMPEEEAEKHIRLMGFSFAKPGKDGKSFNAKLKAGRYAMLCFVSNRRRSEPHFMKGMIHRFNVDPPSA